MAEIDQLPRKRLKSLDEFERPAWQDARAPGWPVAFSLMLASALVAGAIGGLLLF